jgi:hypothetical protein
VTTERDEASRQPTAVAVRLALLAERADIAAEVRNELRLLALASEGVKVLGDGRVAFTTGALATALGLCSRAHLHAWRTAGVGPRCIPLQHGQKTTWMYPVAGVIEWLAAAAIDQRVRPTAKMLGQLAALGMIDIHDPVQVAA